MEIHIAEVRNKIAALRDYTCDPISSSQEQKNAANEAIKKCFRNSGRACSAQVSLSKTLKGDLAPLYEEAREKQWNNLINLGAFEIVERPLDVKTIRSHFVLIEEGSLWFETGWS